MFGNGNINYTEFLSATIDMKTMLDDMTLKALFDQFDTDKDGKVSPANIVTALHKIGHTITQEELDKIMFEHDKDQCGNLHYHEFKAVFIDLEDE